MVILAALPGMVRELLVTGNLVKPGNLSVSVNFLGYRIRKVGLGRQGPGSKCRPACKMQRNMQAWCDLTSQTDAATMARYFGTDPSWGTHSAPCRFLGGRGVN